MMSHSVNLTCLQRLFRFRDSTPDFSLKRSFLTVENPG
jgi:hypothetical protein